MTKGGLRMANGVSVPGYYPFNEFAHCIKHGKGGTSTGAQKADDVLNQGDEDVSPIVGGSSVGTEEA